MEKIVLTFLDKENEPHYIAVYESDYERFINSNASENELRKYFPYLNKHDLKIIKTYA